MNFEAPLTQLVWITSIVSIVFTFAASYVHRPDARGRRRRSGGSSRSSSRAARSPARSSPSSSRSSRRPRARTSRRSSPRPGRAARRSTSSPASSAGNFSAFWIGIVLMVLMGVAYFVSGMGLGATMTVGGDGRLAGLRVRPRRLRLPRHGPGHPRGRLVRPGHRQRAERLRAVDASRPSRTSRRSIKKDFGFDRRLREGQAHARGERRRRATPSRRPRSPCSSAPPSSARPR